MCAGRALSVAALCFMVTPSVHALVCPPTATLASGQLGFGDGSAGQLDGLGEQGAVWKTSAGLSHRIDILPDGRIVYSGASSGEPTVPDDVLTVRDAAAGAGHSAAIRSDGTIASWGSSEFGLDVPPPGNDYHTLCSGLNHVIALRGDQTVVGWGDDGQDQATPLPGLADVKAVACGANHSVALKQDGFVVAWGANGAGQASVPPEVKEIAAIAAGAFHTVALDKTGNVFAWGLKTGGVTDVPPGAVDVQAIAAGDNYSLALLADGTILAWGSAAIVAELNGAALADVATLAAGPSYAVFGTERCADEDGCVAPVLPCALGECVDLPKGFACDCGPGYASVGATTVSVGTVELPAGEDIVAADAYSGAHAQLTAGGVVITNLTGEVPPADTYVDVRVGNTFGLVLGSDGAVVAFGEGKGASLPGFMPPVAQIAAGTVHGLALAQDGSVLAWGDGKASQAPADLPEIKAIAAGNDFSVAVDTTGQLHLWGDGAAQLVGAAAVTDAAEVSGGLRNLAVQHEDGSVSVFGSNGSGQTDVPPDLGPVVTLASGSTFTAALKPDGSVVAWGEGLTIPADFPPVTDLTAGSTFLLGKTVPSCAVVDPCVAGTVDCGDNALCVTTPGSYDCQCDPGFEPRPPFVTHGRPDEAPPISLVRKAYTELGDGWGFHPGGLDFWSPGGAPPYADLTAVATSYGNVSLGVRASGQLVIWGDNYNINSFYSPLPAGTFTRVWGGLDVHAAALRSDGTLVTWGGAYAQGIPGPVSIPNVVDASVASVHGLALKADGTIVAWGNPVGDVAVVPAGLTNVVQIATGPAAAYALRGDGTVVAWGTQTLPFQDWVAALTNIVTISAHGRAFVALDSSGVAHSVVIDAQVHDQPLRARSTEGVQAVAGDDFSVTLAMKPGCMDIDECALGQVTCGPNSHCENLPGSYTCECDLGYFAGINGCEDIDECALGLDDCAGAAGCLNLPGGYECRCGEFTDLGHTLISWGDPASTVPTPMDLTDVVKLDGYGETFGALVDTNHVRLWTSNGLYVNAALDAITSAEDIAVGEGFVAVAHRSSGAVTVHGPTAGSVQPPAGLVDVVALAGGVAHVVALKDDGTVVAWGAASAGTALNVPAGLGPVVQVAAGGNWSAALTASGNVAVWGTGLPSGFCPDCYHTVSAMDGGRYHLLVIKDDGTARCIGGDIQNQQCHVPPALQGGGPDVVKVAAGGRHSLALLADGSVVAWGRNDLGQATVPAGLTSAGVDFLAATESASFVALDIGCIDSDECADGSDLCDPNATCTNEVPGYDCDCNAGWVGTGLVCADEDECLTGNNACSAPTEVCSNLVGTYDCDCDTGFSQVGPLEALHNALPVPMAALGATQISYGQDHGLALLDNGTVIGWGSNSYGKATPPAGITTAVQVAASQDASAVLLADGSIRAWGHPNYANIGLPLDADYTRIAAGWSHFLAVRTDGTVISWGSTTSQGAAVPAGLTGVVDVAAGHNTSYALRADGSVVAWGSNYYGQTSVPGGLSNVTKVVAGWTHAIALRANGEVVWWGDGQANGVSGYGVSLPPGITDAIDVAAGGSMLSVLHADGSVTVTHPTNPATYAPDPGRTAIVGGFAVNRVHALRTFCADTDECTDGTATCPANAACVNTVGGYSCQCAPGYVLNPATGLCDDIDECATGANNCDPPNEVCVNTPGSYDCDCAAGYGYIGPLENFASYPPVQGLPQMGVLHASIGMNHSLAVMQNGTVIGWGDNSQGQAIAPANVVGATQVAAGMFSSAALLADGSIVSWGGTQAAGAPTGTGYVAIAAGALHHLALHSDGTVVAWGDNNEGQASVPPGLANVASIAAGIETSFAVRTDGTVEAWGHDGWGQTSIPTGLSGVTKVVSGITHTMALHVDGTVTWFGHLFLVAPGPSFTMHLPVGINGAVDIAAGQYTMAVLNADTSITASYLDTDFSYPPQANRSALVASYGHAGFLGLSAQCADVDECATGTAVCQPNSMCVNTVGGYDCVCNPGFALNPATGECADIDECLTGVHACDELSEVCVNTQGTYDCDCASGFVVQGPIVRITNPGASPLTGTGLTMGVVELDHKNHHSLAIMTNGKVHGWGENGFGETNVPSSVDVAIDVAAGTNTSVALRPDGTIVAWGDTNAAGAPTGSGYVQVAAGHFHHLALHSDGTVVAWGNNTFGQSTVPAGLTNVASVACASNTSFAVRNDGTVVAWGDGAWGQTSVPFGLTGVVKVAAGTRLAAALKHNGTVVWWGGVDPSGFPSALPTLPPVNDAIDLSVSSTTIAVLHADRSTTVARSFSTNITPPHPGRFAVRSGSYLNSDVALQPQCGDEDECATGTAVCPTNSVCVNTLGSYTCDCDPGWVYNPATGQCDDEDECVLGNHPCDPATQVCVNTLGGVECGCQAGFTQVNPLHRVSGAQGYFMPIVNMDVVDADYDLRNGIAALADGSVITFGVSIDPIITAGAQSVSDVVQVALGDRAGAAIEADGTLHVWDALPLAMPPPPLNPSPMVDIDAARYHFCGLHADGTVSIWGNSSHPGNFHHSVTLPPANLAPVEKLACGQFHVIAIHFDGTVTAWGVWGDGTTVTVPAGLTGVVDAAAGRDYNAFQLSDGTVQVHGTQPAFPGMIASSMQAGNNVWGLDAAGYLVGNGPLSLANVPNHPLREIHIPGYSTTILGVSDMCVDDDECVDGTATCPTGSTCVNTPGGYTCDCGPGYVYNPATGQCDDEDECALGTHPCDPATQVCVNTLGSVECACQAGFTQVNPLHRVSGAQGYFMPIVNMDVVDADYDLRNGIAALADGSVITFGVSIDPIITAGAQSVSDVVQVALGDRAGAAIEADGTLHVWDALPLAMPPPPLNPSPMVDIDAARYHFCGLHADGTVSIWGNSSHPGNFHHSVTLPPANLAPVEKLACGQFHVIAIHFDGTVTAWGVWGDGTTVTVPAGLTGVVDAAAGRDYNAFQLSDGTVQVHGTQPAFPGMIASSMQAGNNVWGLDAAGYLVGNGPLSLANVPNHPLREIHIPGYSTTILGVSDMCIDDDECVDGTAMCPTGATCTNTPGGYSCDCGVGYTVNPATGACEDIDECATGVHDCDPVAEVCVNLPGGFECQCAPGYGPVRNLVNIVGSVALPTFGADVISIDTSRYHGVALLSDGTLDGWGSNTYGELSLPTGPTNVVKVSAAEWATWLLKDDGTIEGFGLVDPQYFAGTASITNAVDIAAGLAKLLVLRADGTIVGFGTLPSTGALSQPSSITDGVAIAAGAAHFLVLRANGTVWAWGNSSPWDQGVVPTGLTDVVQIAAGHTRSIVRKADGSVVEWGDRGPYITTPFPVFTDALDVIASRENSVAVLSADGSVYQEQMLGSFTAQAPANVKEILYPVYAGWGNEQPIWGLAETCGDINECLPSLGGGSVCGPNATCTNLAGSYQCDCLPGFVINPATGACEDEDECVTGTHDCGPTSVCVNTVGGFDCTCSPGYTYSSDPFVINATGRPVLDAPATSGVVMQVSAGRDHAMARMANGDVFVWGENGDGQLDVPASLPSVSRVVADDATSIVLQSNGTVVSWGAVPYPTLQGIVALDAEGGRMATINLAGVVAEHGNLGLSPPIPQPAGVLATAVAVGADHSLGLLSDGTVIAWGSDTYGQASVPASAVGVISIAAGSATSAAVLANHTIVAWGQDPGDMFTWLGGFTDAVSVAIRDESAVVIRAGGGVSSWTTGTGAVNHPNASAGVPTDNGPLLLSVPDCQDLDECQVAQTGCDDNATCVNLPGSFECQCNPGFSGNGYNCVQDDVCDPNPCANGAGCLPVFGGGFDCFCPAGWYGALCDKRLVEDCSNGADDDDDGLADCLDPDCANWTPCSTLDPDDDGVPTGVEELCGTDPLDGTSTPSKGDLADLDGDGILGCLDDDDDGDGLTDAIEALLGTDPVVADSDDDGLLDGQEDANHDGVVGATETSPLNPDTDADGLGDFLEATACYGVSKTEAACARTAGWNADTDGDGLPDGTEDANANGVVDKGETNPTLADTDGDGFDDVEELACATDPASAKSSPVDGDSSGTCDGAEEDGDNDGWSDGVETLCGTDPASAKETPLEDALGDYDGDGIPNCLDGDTVVTETTGCASATGAGSASRLVWMLALLLGLFGLAVRRRRRFR